MESPEKRYRDEQARREQVVENLDNPELELHLTNLADAMSEATGEALYGQGKDGEIYQEAKRKEITILERHGEMLYAYLKKKLRVLEENGISANDAERALLKTLLERYPESET